MAANVGQLSTDELKELGDPDQGLEIRAGVRDRLLRQKKAVANGERGEELEEVVKAIESATMAEVVEDGPERLPAKGDVTEDIIHLPERDPNSIAHIRSPRLVHREQVKDFEVKVIEDVPSK